MVMAAKTIYTMYRKANQDVVIAIDSETGKTIWESPINAPHLPGMNVEAGPGPHSTPSVANGLVFVTTVIGHLVALDQETGARRWSHDLWTEYKGNFLERGYASSPLLYKESVIVPVGGPGSALIAFRQGDGTKLWSAGDFHNAYSSPIIVNAGGREQVVSFMAKNVFGVDANSGRVLWDAPHKTQYDINAAPPVWCEESGILVVSSAYDGGARALDLTEGAKELWHHNRLRIHHTNMLCTEGIVYGSSGDFGPAPLTAVEAKTGKVLWQSRAFTKASFLLRGKTLYVTDDDGSVGMASISPQGLTVIGEAQLLRANSWTVPLLDGSRLFVRDRHRLVALQLE
jgi:outer membrane protein assembly factor BamB